MVFIHEVVFKSEEKRAGTAKTFLLGERAVEEAAAGVDAVGEIQGQGTESLGLSPSCRNHRGFVGNLDDGGVMAWRLAGWQRMILGEADPGCHRVLDRIAPDNRAAGRILIGSGTGGRDRALSELGGEMPGQVQIAATALRQLVGVHGREDD
jgi:hypothetical protein